MWPPGPLELVILLVIVLLVFGARRLPELGRSLGDGMREFKDSITGSRRDDANGGETEAAQLPKPAETAEPVAEPKAEPEPATKRDADSSRDDSSS